MLLAPIAALFMTMHTSPASATALATTVDPSALDITAKVSAAPVCSDGDHRSLTFAVVGDWGRKGKWHQQEVADVMSRVCGLRTCDFVVSVGDNFYETGVESVEDKGWEDSYEKIYTGPSLQKRWFSVLGNHDYLGQTQAQIDYTQLSSRWFMPARYFTSSISTACARDGSASSVDFFFIDTTPMIDDYRQKPAYVSRGDVTKQDASLQLLWLDKALSDSKAEWKIVVGHHPVHSGALGGEKDLQKRLEPLLQKHGIQAYICGHDHDLQHIVYSTDGLVGGGAIHYVVSGAGSQTWPIFVGTQGVQWHSTQSGFMLLTLSSAKEMTLESFVWDGSNPYTATASIGER